MTLKEEFEIFVGTKYKGANLMFETSNQKYIDWLESVIMQDRISDIADEKYIPQSGDLFKWCDEEYWCVSSDFFSGTVNPVGESCYVNSFIWNYANEDQIFIRKGDENELKRLGISGK